MPIANYFNRRALAGFVAKRYAALRFHGRQFVESAEANETQDIIFERIAAVGDTLLGAVSLRRGGTIVVDRVAATVRLGEAEIWAGGYLHKVPAATLTGVPMVGTVVIGIAVAEAIVDGEDDPQLRGIVPNTASHGELTASRLRYDAVWARGGDPFFAIHTLVDGALPNEIAPPSTDVAELLVERHLRETHGSHVSEGFQVSPAGFTAGTGEQTFIIGAGVLRAEGRRVSRSIDQRYSRVEDPTLVQVNGETHNYPAGGVVTLNNGPIAAVDTVTAIRQVTETVTHQLANGTDALARTPVYAILSVSQGGTVYAENTSWTRSGDGISWAPAGAEPAPGSTYTVTYQYTATIPPAERVVGRQTITIPSAVEGRPVTVQYRYKLARVDVVAIDLDGSVVYLPGISSRFNPAPPPVPAQLAPLARVENNWGLMPNVVDFGQRRVTEAEVQAVIRDLLDVADLVSLVRLERDIQDRDPSSRRGSFVDPFRDENQRDLGIAQDAAIVDGLLQLPIDVVAQTVNLGTAPILLPYVTEAVISQPYRTLSRKINRYANFAPLPSPLALQPSVDRWNERQRTSSSSRTQSFQQISEYRPDLLGTPLYGTTTTTRTQTSQTSVTRRTQDLPFLRQIDVGFVCRRMGPNENLQRLLFDGIDVTASVTGTKRADAAGTLTGTFRIPANVRAGAKAVVVRGAGGSLGETGFVGQGTLTVENYHTATHTRTVAVTIDPIAQSFVLGEMRQITGWRVEFTERGDPAKHVVIEMRDMDGGLPGRTTYAEGSIPGTFALGDPTTVRPENWTEISYDSPVTVPANEWRWNALLTDDANHSVAIAQLGDQSDPNSPRGFDARRQEWIRENPGLGDLADGSNAVSWLLDPSSDMTQEVMAARFTALTRTVALGSFNLNTIQAGGISDIIVLLVAEEPSAATRVRIEMVRANGEVIAFEPNTPLRLDAYLTETVTMRMVLTGTATLSPIVMPECQILWGRLKATARYVSEANAIDLSNGAVKIRTVLETATPGTSSIAVAIGAEGNWDAQVANAAVALGDGWIEREHLETPFNAAEVRTQITLTGTPAHRPLARQLRQRATGA